MRTITALQNLIISGVATLVFQSSAVAYIDLGSSTKSTPYDRYMSPVKRVINSIDAAGTPMREVNSLMRTARGFRYSFDTAYVARTPQETARRRAGDCKDKSLWLADAMGDRNVRFVIGKLSSRSRINHAWLYWEHNGEWFVLDPTHHSRPIAVSSLASHQYVPFYSYAKNATFQHSTVMPMFAAVASKKQKVAKVVRVAPEREAAPVRTASRKMLRVKKAPIAEAPTVKANTRVAKQKDFAARLRAMDGGRI